MKRNRGFTLIELMIVVLVLGILAAIAVPSYLKQVRKSRRGEIEGYIQQVALMEERYRADCPTYGTSFGTMGSCNNNIGPSPYGPTTPYFTLSIIPASTGTVKYKVEAVALTTGGQDKDVSYNGSSCATLDYDFGATSAGIVTKTPATCWNQ
jgi:type IV pilus assembly protein PilE